MGFLGVLGSLSLPTSYKSDLNSIYYSYHRILATADSLFGTIFGYLGRSRNPLQLNTCLTTDRYPHGKAGKDAACLQLSPLFVLAERLSFIPGRLRLTGPPPPVLLLALERPKMRRLASIDVFF